MSNFRHGALLDALRNLRWPARRAVTGALPGAHRSRQRGSAPELSEYRLYRQGDDPRRLDWKLLARSNRAYVRLADDHSVLPTIFLLDASASMDFPQATSAKWEQACALAIGLAAVAHAGGDPVGLVAPTEKGMVVLPPRSRRDVVHEMARALGSMTPGGSINLAPSLAATRRGARVVIVTDFLGDAEALRRSAREHAAAGGEIFAVHIVAREELEPGPRAVLAVDPEEPSLARPLGSDALSAYRDRFAAWRDELAREWRLAGASYALVTTDENAAVATRRIVRGAAEAERA